MATATKSKSKSRPDVYQMVTDTILEALEQDIIPWRKPWVARAGESYGEQHRNIVSGRPYRGINPFLLEIAALTRGYSSPYWLTFKQLRELGANLVKVNGADDKGTGQKSTTVTFWHPFKTAKKDASGKPVKDKHGKPVTEKRLMLRYYNVFNVDQCEQSERLVKLIERREAAVRQAEELRAEFTPIEAAEAVFADMPNRPVVSFGGGRAFYAPAADSVRLPDREDFSRPEDFYCTAYHELVHATGHESRLGRHGAFGHAFGTPGYAREELTAEMGSSMLAAIVGIDFDTPNTASYVRSWLSKGEVEDALRDDKRLIVSAAARAQRAADYILGEGAEDAQPTNGEMS